MTRVSGGEMFWFDLCRNGDVHLLHDEFLLRLFFPLCLGLGRPVPLSVLLSERHGRRRSLLFVHVETGSLFEIGVCVTGFQKKNWREARQELIS